MRTSNYIILWWIAICALVTILFYICVFIMTKFPKSKLGNWIRKNIVTDEDLEQSTKREPLEKGLLDDDVLEPPI